jgi:hypothetical protein
VNDELPLLAALTQCFEKDEVLQGYHLRTVPFRTKAIAETRFAAWRNEASAWLGPPMGEDRRDDWQRVWWPDLRMKRSSRGISLWIRTADVGHWWNNPELWRDPGLEGLWSWDPE